MAAFIAKIQHSRWTVLGPIGLLFVGSLTGSLLRAGCLIAAVLISIWIFYDTELAKGSPEHSLEQRRWRSGAAAVIFALIAVGAFIGADRVENWWSKQHKLETPNHQSDTTLSTPKPNPRPNFAVYAEFLPIQRAHPELGNAMEDFKADGAYEARHEHATVLWVKSFGGWIIWPTEPDKEWINYPELGWNEEIDSDADSEKVTGRKAPHGLYQPRGGLALLFSQDIKAWITKVGWRKSQCLYDDVKSIHWQLFDNGWIIGPFRQWSKSPDGTIIVLWKNRKRDLWPVDTAPACRNIAPH